MKKIEIVTIPQNGHICKPVVIAMIDATYAKKHGFKAFPLNKKNNPLHQRYRHVISIRELAKRVGSVQGELLEIKQVENLAKLIGYTTELVDVDNQFDLFKQTIINAINEEQLIFACFSVDTTNRIAGKPTISANNKDKNEHAAIIHGYDDNDIYFTHWGQERSCTFEEFYAASLTLLAQRTPEYYENVKGLSPGQFKYDLVENPSDKTSHTLVKKSIIPGPSSGFRAKLLIVKMQEESIFNEIRKKLIKDKQLAIVQIPHHFNISSNIPPPQDTLQIRHLSHVFLDGEIDGTQLTGDKVFSVIENFNHFIVWLINSQSTQNQTSLIIQKIARASTSLDRLVVYKLKQHLEEIYEHRKQQNHVINKYKNQITLDDVALIEGDLYLIAQQLIDELKTKGQLFLFGGFSGNPSHSILYQINKQEDSIYFCAYDASNLAFHETDLLPSGHRGHYPAFVFKFSESANKQTFPHFFVALLKLEILPRINSKLFTYDERDLYQVLHSGPTWLNGSILSARKFSSLTTRMLGGTCVWKTMEQLVKILLPEETQSHHFLIAYQLFCFSTASAKFKTLLLEPANIQTIMRRSLARLAQGIQEQKTELIERSLNTDDFERLSNYLRQWKLALTRQVSKTNERVKLYQDFSHRQSSDFINSDLQQYSAVLIPTYNVFEHSEEVFSDYNARDHTFDETIKMLSDFKLRHTSNEGVFIRVLEQFCFYYCNPTNVISFAHPLVGLEDQRILIISISSILKQYHFLKPDLTPHKTVICLGLMGILERLGQEKILHFGEVSLTGRPFYQNKMHDFICRLAKNSFISTFDPKLDAIWERLRDFFSKEQTSASRISYYIRLCDQAPDEEKEILQQQWGKFCGDEKESVELISAINKLFYNLGNPAYYCFLNNDEQAKLRQSTPELNLAFEVQKAFENTLALCLQYISCIASSQHSYKLNFHIGSQIDLTYEYIHDNTYNERAVEITVQSIFFPNDAEQLSLFIKNTLLEEKERESNLPNNVLLSSFYGQVLNSQEIPFALKKENLQPNQYLKNLLYHLRVSKSCQVTALLSELCNHPRWLKDEHLNRYVILTVFHPGALLHALRNGIQLELILETLWNKVKDGPSDLKWSLLKLALMITNYAVEAAEQKLVINDLKMISPINWQKRTLAAAEQRLIHLTKNKDVKQLQELHHMRLLALLLNLNVKGNFVDSFWSLTQSSLLLSAREEEQIQQTLERLSSYFSNSPIAIVQTKQLFQLENQENVSIDFLRRKIVGADNRIVVFIPSYIQDKPEFFELFSQQPPLTKKHEATLKEETYDVYMWGTDQSYRILFCKNANCVYFQKWQNNLWYTYTTPSEAMKEYLGFQHHAFKEAPPALLEQAHYRAWYADENHWAIVSVGSKDFLYEKNGSISSFNTLEQALLNKSIESSILLRFENPKFIRIYDRQGVQHFSLERYGLDFYHLSGQYHTDDNRYTVVNEIEEDWFGSGLTLKDNVHQRNFLIIPIQPYYICKENNTDPLVSETHYIWIHDLSDEIKQQFLFGDTRPFQHPGWNYSSSEQYAKFEIDQHNQLKANSSRDRLYLVYLYLAQDRPKKALECLRSCLMKGTFDEMNLLWWIVTKLPHNSTKYLMKNSRVIAVQLTALYAMLTLVKHSSAWMDTAPNFPHHPISNTAIYYAKNKEQLVAFIKNLSKNIASFYAEYDAFRQQLPINMHLCEADEKILLSFCVANLSSGDLPNKSAILTRYLAYFPEEQRFFLYEVPLHSMSKKDYVLEPSRWVSWLETIRVTNRPYLSCLINQTLTDENTHKLLQSLNPYMDEIVLLRNFRNYYTLARLCKNELFINTLRHFCKTTISLYAKRDDKNRQRDATLLLVSEIIWAVLHSKDSFPLSDNAQNPLENWTSLSKIAEENLSSIPPATPFIFVANVNLNKYRVHAKETTYIKKEAAEDTESNSILLPFIPLDKICVEIYDKLLEVETNYQRQEETIFATLKKSHQLAFSEQQQEHTRLDKQYFTFQMEKMEKQEAIFKQYPELQNVSFENAKKDLQQKIESERQEIDLILTNRTISIGELAKKVRAPTVEELLQTSHQFQEKKFEALGLQSAQINRLQERIQKLLSLYNGQKRLQILEEAIHDYKNDNTPEKRSALSSAFINQALINQKNQALFEYVNQLALRPEQIRFMKLIIDKENNLDERFNLFKLIMGGGKTKLTMPLWAHEAADGDKLVIVLVSATSFETNYSDLAGISRHSFHQEAYSLNVKRYPSQNFEAVDLDQLASLKELFQKLETIRQGKGYVISCPTTWQSIELKYIETLKTSFTSYEESLKRERKLEWLGRILKLVKEKSTVVIDEPQCLLHIKRELVYALGNAQPVATNDIFTTVNLYFWLMEHPESIKQFICNPSANMDDDEIASLMSRYIQSLCEALQKDDAPEWIKNLVGGSISKNQLSYYLSGISPDEETLDFLNGKPLLKQQWALLRDQFQVMLPITLRAKCYENYGPSPNVLYAIPYRSSNVPTEFVYGNLLMTIDYTIQMIIYDGLSAQNLKAVLTQWQDSAISEQQENKNQITSLEIKFLEEIKTDKFGSLVAINLNDADILEQLLVCAKQSNVFLREAAIHCLLGLTTEPYTLKSDSINLISQFHRVLALTGTPNNHQTYHQNIQLAVETTLDNQEEITQNLIKKTGNITHFVEPHNLLVFIKEQIKTSKKIRALIDYGGFFRGVNNQKAAKLLSSLFPNAVLRYILFFQEDTLCALEIASNAIKFLSSTKASTVRTELDCSPEQYLTYYDQEHTTGMDIEHDAEACAILTADITAGQLSSFTQAAARMRGLCKKQSLIIATNKEGLSVEHLRRRLQQQEMKALESEYFIAGIKKIKDVFRQEILIRLLEASEAKKRDTLFNKVELFFIENQQVDMALAFEQVTQVCSSRDILLNISKTLRQKWCSILGESHTLFLLDKKVNTVIEKTLNVCAATQRTQSTQDRFSFQEILKHQEKQNEIQKQHHLLNEECSLSLVLQPIDCSWLDSYLNNKRVLTAPLLSSVVSDRNVNFSKDLHASEHFLYTYREQREVFNQFTKPGLAILFVLEENVKGIILCMEEAEAALKLITSQPPSRTLLKCCLMTINGHLYHRWASPISPDQQTAIERLIEQAQFFTGKLEVLLSKTVSSWFSENTEEKKRFLEEHLHFTGIEQSNIERLHQRYASVEPYLSLWAKPPERETTTQFLQRLAQDNLPETILKRIKTIFLYIDKVRGQPTTFLTKKMLGDMPRNDANFVYSYYLLRTWIRRWANKKRADVVITFFLKHEKSIDLNHIKYINVQETLPMGSSLLIENFKNPIFLYLIKHQYSKVAPLFQDVLDNPDKPLSYQESYDRLTFQLLFEENGNPHNWSLSKTKQIAFLLRIKFAASDIKIVIENWSERSEPTISIGMYRNFSRRLMKAFLFDEKGQLRSWDFFNLKYVRYILDQNFSFKELKLILSKWEHVLHPIAFIREMYLDYNMHVEFFFTKDGQLHTFNNNNEYLPYSILTANNPERSLVGFLKDAINSSKISLSSKQLREIYNEFFKYEIPIYILKNCRSYDLWICLSILNSLEIANHENLLTELLSEMVSDLEHPIDDLLQIIREHFSVIRMFCSLTYPTDHSKIVFFKQTALSDGTEQKVENINQIVATSLETIVKKHGASYAQTLAAAFLKFSNNAPFYKNVFQKIQSNQTFLREGVEFGVPVPPQEAGGRRAIGKRS